MFNMRRREFITLLGGAAVAWPLRARAQSERMRRIGVLMPLPADDPQSQRRATAFLQGLEKLGWTDGRNVRIDSRWGAFDADRSRKYAAEMVALAPDVVLAAGASVERAARGLELIPSLVKRCRQNLSCFRIKGRFLKQSNDWHAPPLERPSSIDIRWEWQ